MNEDETIRLDKAAIDILHQKALDAPEQVPKLSKIVGPIDPPPWGNRRPPSGVSSPHMLVLSLLDSQRETVDEDGNVTGMKWNPTLIACEESWLTEGVLFYRPRGEPKGDVQWIPLWRICATEIIMGTPDEVKAKRKLEGESK